MNNGAGHVGPAQAPGGTCLRHSAMGSGRSVQHASTGSPRRERKWCGWRATAIAIRRRRCGPNKERIDSISSAPRRRG